MTIQNYSPQDAIEIDPDQPWAPALFGKQWDVFNCTALMLLVSGSRGSGKTSGCLDKIWRHLWETPGASFAVIAKSKSLAKGGGSWEQLTGHIAERWLKSGMVGQTGIPIAYTTKNSEGPGPKESANTRTPSFKIRNYYGGESECILLSVTHDNEVEEKLKNKYFSGIFVIELSMFKDPGVLINSLQCLRLPHLATPDGVKNPWYLWMADTNPDEELGNRSWIYKMFFTDRKKTVWYDERDVPDPVERQRKNEDAAIHFKSMEVIEMFYQDNPFFTRHQAITLEMSCEGDPARYDSWVLGKWGDAGRKRNKLFANVFVKELHVVGGPPNGQIDVNPLSTTLYSGWDMGSVNHAAALLDKWPISIRGKNLSGFSILDELVFIDQQLKISDFGIEVQKKMKAIEAIHSPGKPLHWVNWTDTSAIEMWRPTSGTFDYLEVKMATGINLSGVTKPTIQARIKLLRKLIHQNRLYVSACCYHTIKMLMDAQSGDDSEKDPFDERGQMKHIFDAITYPIYMECYMEMMEASEPPKSTSNRNIITSTRF